MTSETTAATVRRSWALDLDAATLYALLRLRVEVFVVEQACAYREIDGRDLEPRARHYWLSGDGQPAPVLGCVRLLKEPDGDYRIGRLCVVRGARGRGLGRRLMEAVLAEVGDGGCVLDAQEQIVEFYRGFRFQTTGPVHDCDGFLRQPMRRPAR